MQVLVTGGLGFIGSHLVDTLVNLRYDVVVVDALKIGSDIANANPSAKYYNCDLTDYDAVCRILRDHDFVQIYHLAAESHVDRAIANAQPFIDSNITGTYNIYRALASIDTNKRATVLLFSTDEVMGELEQGSFKEGDAPAPKNLYSVTKLAQEGIARSYAYSDRISTVVTRCSNIYGPRQQEKFLPTMIKCIKTGQHVPVYGDGTQVREWTYVQDAVDGAIFAINNSGPLPEQAPIDFYHIGSGIEKQNIDVVKFVLKETVSHESFISYVPDRKGHDKRYSLNTDKMNKMGWFAKVSFEDGMKKTIHWYMGRK